MIQQSLLPRKQSLKLTNCPMMMQDRESPSFPQPTHPMGPMREDLRICSNERKSGKFFVSKITNLKKKRTYRDSDPKRDPKYTDEFQLQNHQISLVLIFLVHDYSLHHKTDRDSEVRRSSSFQDYRLRRTSQWHGNNRCTLRSYLCKL